MTAACSRLPLALLLVLIGLGSCTTGGRDDPADPTSFSYYRDPALDGTRRVLVLPLYHGQGVGRSARTLDEATATAWRELGRFEVVVTDAETRNRLLVDDPVASNTISADELRRIHAAYRVDAVLVGRVELFDSYDPIACGVVLDLISCHDGGVLWAAAGHFDGRRADIQRDIRRWHATTIGEAQPDLAGWRGTLQSPGLFARYVSDRLASSALWRSPPPPGPRPRARPRPR